MYSEEITQFDPKTGAITKTTRKTRGLEQITTYGDDIKSTYTVDQKRGVCVEKLYQKETEMQDCTSVSFFESVFYSRMKPLVV